MFEKCGKIASCSVPLDKITGRNKGFSFLAFEERAAAEEAKQK
jgi:RNA recognition motif-containing protein